jgi:hypothetical protein
MNTVCFCYIENDIVLSDRTTIELNKNNETTEDKLKSTQSPLDGLLSTTDNLSYDSSNAVMDNTNIAKNVSVNVKENGVKSTFNGNGVFFGGHCEEVLGALLAKSPTFRGLYGKINSSEGFN